MMGSAFEITRALGGDWQGSFGLAPDIGHSPKDRGLKIWDAPNLPGGVGVHSFHGLDFREVRDALAAQGLLPKGGDGWPVDLAERERRRLENEQYARAREERARSAARSIWGKASPAAGTLAETYLSARAVKAPPPPTLRFAPSHKHAKSGQRFPVMVGAVQSAGGDIVGVHRTYLRADGCGKADVTPDKAMLGPCAGGAVRFAKPQKRLAVGEGIETVLSFAQNTGLPVWAALSTAGLRNLILPEIVRDVVIAADRDDNGAGERAANDAADGWHREGRRVQIVFPPDGFKDFNDAIRADGE